MEYQSLISIAPWTFIFQILNLLLQAYLFKRFLFAPIAKILQKRQDEVNGVYDAASKAKTDAEAAKADYEAHLLTAREEAEGITTRAISSARERSEQLLREATEDAAAIREKAQRDIELDRRKAMSEIKGEISDLAVQIASKVVQKEIDASDHEALVARFIDELGENA